MRILGMAAWQLSRRSSPSWTWELVKLLVGTKAIGNRFTFDKKFDANGGFGHPRNNPPYHRWKRGDMASSHVVKSSGFAEGSLRETANALFLDNQSAIALAYISILYARPLKWLLLTSSSAPLRR
jgi:hypothetical protein